MLRRIYITERLGSAHSWTRGAFEPGLARLEKRRAGVLGARLTLAFWNLRWDRVRLALFLIVSELVLNMMFLLVFVATEM